MFSARRGPILNPPWSCPPRSPEPQRATEGHPAPSGHGVEGPFCSLRRGAAVSKDEGERGQGLPSRVRSPGPKFLGRNRCSALWLCVQGQKAAKTHHRLLPGYTSGWAEVTCSFLLDQTFFPNKYLLLDRTYITPTWKGGHSDHPAGLPEPLRDPPGRGLCQSWGPAGSGLQRKCICVHPRKPTVPFVREQGTCAVGGTWLCGSAAVPSTDPEAVQAQALVPVDPTGAHPRVKPLAPSGVILGHPSPQELSVAQAACSALSLLPPAGPHPASLHCSPWKPLSSSHRRPHQYPVTGSCLRNARPSHSGNK